MIESHRQELAQLVARYVDAWCNALTSSASDTRSSRHAEALRALLRALGRLFVPGTEVDALSADAGASSQQQAASRQPLSSDALLAESVSRLRASVSEADEAAEEARHSLTAAEDRLVATAAAAAANAPGDAAAALRAALHASGRFQLLADSLLTGTVLLQHSSTSHLQCDVQSTYRHASTKAALAQSDAPCASKRQCFQKGDAINILAAVVAGEWLLRLPATRPLLEKIFQQAPASAALLALVS